MVGGKAAVFAVGYGTHGYARGAGRFAPAFRAAVLCVLLLALLLPARATENPLYTITGVEVDMTAETAAEAKKLAITDANVKAFSMLAQRVGADEAALAEVAKIPAKQIDAMLNSLSIEEERTGPGRYIGKLTVRFLPGRAKTVLNGLGVNYSE